MDNPFLELPRAAVLGLDRSCEWYEAGFARNLSVQQDAAYLTFQSPVVRSATISAFARPAPRDWSILATVTAALSVADTGLRIPLTAAGGQLLTRRPTTLILTVVIDGVETFGGPIELAYGD